MKKGFTLSEVLITLGIIGIVSVLTIPSIMKNYRNRLYVAQLKKIQAQISDAAVSMMNDENVSTFSETKIGVNCPAGTADIDCPSGLQYFFNQYFKVIKHDCGTGKDNSCVAGATTYKHLDGSGSLSMPDTYCVQTVNGPTICSFYNPGNKCLSMIVDVNAQAEPNTIGRDVFSMDMHQDGSIADYASGCTNDNYGCVAGTCNNNKTGSIYDIACGCYNTVKDAGWEITY